MIQTIRYSGVKKRILILAAMTVTAVTFISCDNNVFVSFMFPEKEKVLTATKEGVDVTLRLSSDNPVRNALWIVNKSDRRIWVGNRSITLKVDESPIEVPVIKNYDVFIKKANRMAKLLCNEMQDPYSCVDQITERSKRYIGKGFSFGGIEPGKEDNGYIAFDFPSPLNTGNSRTNQFKKLLRRGKYLKGAKILLKLKFGAVVETCEFPVNIRIYDDTKYLPAALKSFWKVK